MRTCVRCAAGWMYCALFCFSLLLGGRTEGGVKICSFAFAFRSTLGFCLSSGTDCRVRRRMHAPFPGPYVSTLALNFNPTLHILLFLLILLHILFSLSLSLSLSALEAFA